MALNQYVKDDINYLPKQHHAVNPTAEWMDSGMQIFGGQSNKQICIYNISSGVTVISTELDNGL